VKILLAFGVAAALAVSLTLLHRRESLPVVAADIGTPAFDSTWNDRVPVLAKADREPIKMTDRVAQTVAVIPVQTVAVTPDPPSIDARVKPKRESRQESRQESRHVEHDICRGKGKRWYNHHRSWRCNR
jgi:hypothetical protein